MGWSMSTQFDQLLEPQSQQQSSQIINSPISELYDDHNETETEKKEKKSRKRRKKKKATNVQNGLKPTKEVNCVWSKQPSPSFATGSSFMALQAEDEQQQKLQSKRKQIQHIKRRHDEIKTKKQEVMPTTAEPKGKLIKNANPWQTNGIKPINLSSSLATSSKPKVLKVQKVSKLVKKNKKQ